MRTMSFHMVPLQSSVRALGGGRELHWGQGKSTVVKHSTAKQTGEFENINWKNNRWKIQTYYVQLQTNYISKESMLIYEEDYCYIIHPRKFLLHLWMLWGGALQDMVCGDQFSSSPWGSWGSNSGPQACAKCQYPLNHLTGRPRKLEQKDTFYYFQHDTVFFLFCSNYSSKLHCFNRQTPQQLGKGRKMVSLHLIITAVVYLVCRSQVFCQTP